MLKPNSIWITLLALLALTFSYPPSALGAGTAPATIICPNCGTENPAGSQFCGNCGRPLTPPEPAPKPETPPQVAPQKSPAIPRVECAVSIDTIMSQLGQLNDDDLRQFTERLVARMQEEGLWHFKDSATVGAMTRADLEKLLRQILSDSQAHPAQPPAGRGFVNFLAILGGISLITLILAII